MSKDKSEVSGILLLRTLCLFLLTWLALFPSNIHGATIYVNSSHVGAENGSITAPWNTMAEALENSTSGDMIMVQGGIYSEVVVNKAVGIVGADKDQVVFQSSNEDVHIFQITADNASISNLTIQVPLGIDHYGVYATGVENVNVSNVSIDGEIYLIKIINHVNDLNDDSDSHNENFTVVYNNSGIVNGTLNVGNISLGKNNYTDGNWVDIAGDALKADGNEDGDLKDAQDYTLYNGLYIIDSSGGDVQLGYTPLVDPTYNNGTGTLDPGEVLEIGGSDYLITDPYVIDQEIELGPAIKKVLVNFSIAPIPAMRLILPEP